MKILSFDTAGEFCSVAIYCNDQLIAFDQDVTCSLQAAELLLPMIDKVMKVADFSYRELDYVALTKGPGSFTGIRVGLSAAQGIFISTNANPLVFSNFALWNYRAQTQMSTKFDASVVVIRAYSGQFYVQIFEYCSNSQDPLLISLEDLKHYIEHLSNKVVAFVGSGISYISDPFFKRPNFLFLPRFVNAKFLGKLAYELIAAGGIESSHIEVCPLYMKPPSVGGA